MPVSQATKRAIRSNGKPHAVVALHPASLSHLRPAAAPAPPTHSIARSKLVRELMQVPESTVIALVAPAGYGKSVLLSLWAECDPRTFAWIELSEHDDDPTRLSQRLAHTIASLSHTGEHAVLVLDRLDRLTSPEALAVVADLAQEPPPALTLAVASRRDPPLAFGRLRVAERLLVLQASELAMSIEEADCLMQAIGVALDREVLQRLATRAEGWPAGLHLAALSLRAQSVSGSEEIEITGEEHTIAEYVSQEVLAALESDARAILRHASILDELSGALCDAVLARQGTGRILADLADTGMLVALNPAHTRFRCQRLVRDVLRRELELCEPTEIPLLHRRACDWFAMHGEDKRALEHAFAARDPQLAGKLAWARAADLLYGHDEQVWDWLRRLSAKEIGSSPELALMAAHSELAFGDLPSATHWAGLAEEALDHTRQSESDASSLRAAVWLVYAASSPDRIEQMAVQAARARRQLDRRSEAFGALAGVLGGVAAQLLGELDTARALLARALEDCSSEAMPLLAALSLTQLALIEVEEDQLGQAEDRAVDAELLIRHLGRRRFSALTHATLAFVKSCRGLSEEAKRELACASRLLALPGELMPWLEVETRVVMARTSVRLADAIHARALLSQASRLARRHQPVPRLLSSIDEAWGEIDQLGAAAMSGPGSLTMAELRVLRFLPTHLSFREIGERLHVSGNTVKSQAHAIYAKLDAASRTEAVARASALGLVDAAVV